MTSADFIREHSWLVGAAVLFIVVLFSMVRRLAKRNLQKHSTKAASWKSPDDLPDLSQSLKRIRIITIIAAGCIIGFTLMAVFNSL